MYSIVMTLYGFTEDVNQLIILRALQGVASGIVWPITSTMIVDMVKTKDRSKALGLYEMMWFLGMIIGPGLGGILAGTFTVAFPFYVCGVLAFLSMLLVALRVEETATTNKVVKKRSEISRTTSSIKAVKGIRQWTVYPMMFLGLCITRFIIAFSNSLIQPVLSVYSNEVLGISTAGVGILFMARGLIMLFTTLPMGTVADTVGRKPTLILGTLLNAIATFLIIFSGGFWPLLFLMMLRGFGRATINPSLTAMFSNITSIPKRGRAMGIFNAFQNVGLVVGSSIGGFLYELSSSEAPFIACFFVGLIGVLLILFVVSEPRNHSASDHE